MKKQTPRMSRTATGIVVFSALMLAASLVYLPVTGFDFVNYDDDLYVYENPMVLKGITLEGLRWAMKSFDEANWHPLTWLSHMLDVQIFGLHPGGHHLTSVLLHLLNTGLLLLLWVRMTGAFWPSAAVAALFALHPLHVESVAWVAERKDVLSTLFWLLTSLAYLKYTQTKGAVPYLLTVILFAFGLMAKPMVVSLPFALLLLDYWPLNRFRQEKGGRPYLLLLEKAPFFALAALSAGITIFAQQAGGAVTAIEKVSLAQRMANAVVSYGAYVVKTLWPANLGVFYPFRLSIPPWQIYASALFLLAVTALVIVQRRRRPWLIVGWFWFLGTLVPVIGIVKVGSQAMADRYTYIPLIGLFVAASWSLAERIRPLTGRARTVLFFLTAGLFTAMSVLSGLQVRFWKDSITLFGHALTATPINHIAHYNLAVALEKKNRKDEAISHYRQAIEDRPGFFAAYNKLGLLLHESGRRPEAADMFGRALQIRPDYWQARYNLARTLEDSGELAQAIAQYEKVLDLFPKHMGALMSLAGIYARIGQENIAAAHLRKVLEIDPELAVAHYNLACMEARQGNHQEAMKRLKAAIDKGFVDWNHIRTDPDLDPVRSDPQFTELLKRAG